MSSAYQPICLRLNENTVTQIWDLLRARGYYLQPMYDIIYE